MPTFRYEAVTAAGKPVRDSVEASSSDSALRKLRALGYFPTRVREAGKPREAVAPPRAGGRRKTLVFDGVPRKQLTEFTREFCILQDAGLPIVRSLKILEDQLAPCALKNALIDIAEDVESGSTLSDAMARHPRAYDRLYVNLVRAGESGGVLDTILSRLADFMEKSQRLRRKILGAMVYPAVVITVALLILTAIILFIVPRFEVIYLDFNIPGGIPAPTRALIAVSRAVASHGYWIPVAAAAFWIALRFVRAAPRGRYCLDALKLRLPVVGNVISKSVISRFTRTLGTLCASGVPILDALAILRDGTGNAVLSRAVDHVHACIRQGEPLAPSLAQTGVCSKLVVNMIDVGEQTGELDKMLLKVADNYEEQVDVAVESMVSALEPILIVLLGLCVGTIVICLFLPILRILTGFGAM